MQSMGSLQTCVYSCVHHNRHRLYRMTASGMVPESADIPEANLPVETADDRMYTMDYHPCTRLQMHTAKPVSKLGKPLSYLLKQILHHHTFFTMTVYCNSSGQ